tara:strand:- start:789 stop:1163 length:375 start_codon:yes stop_codon:yes gene_type:complete
MSTTPESEEMYSMAVDDASHIKKQTRVQIEIIDDLLRSHYTTKVPAEEFNENLLSLLCEVNNVNIRLYNIVDQHLEEQPREEVGGEEELILNAEQIALIQALTLSQYMINSEMVRYENISTALH